MRKNFTTTTHPHGYMLTQKDPNFGFVRISKNASTTISSIPEFKLKRWTSIKGFKGNIYVALRDPIDRFFSSIPETLIRFRHPAICEKENQMKQDVNISYDVYDFFLHVEIEKLDKFIIKYIELIESFGFFDSHHEPQIYFLTDLTGKFYHDMFLFDITSSKEFLTRISKIENLNFNISIKKKNDGSLKSGQKFGNSFFTIRDWFMKHNSQRKKYNYNPLYRWSFLNNVPFSSSRTEFYKKIKTFKADKLICSKIKNLYEKDINLFNKVKQRNLEFNDFYFISSKSYDDNFKINNII